MGGEEEGVPVASSCAALSTQTSKWAREAPAWSRPKRARGRPPKVLICRMAVASAASSEWKRDTPRRWARIRRAVSGDTAGRTVAVAVQARVEAAAMPQESFMVGGG